MSAGLVVFFSALGGCGDGSRLSLAITPGLESGALDAAPRVERFVIAARLPDGSLAAAATAARGATFALEDLDPRAPLGFEVAGLDASGEAVMRGASPEGLRLETLEGSLPVFVGRLGAFARPPGGLVGEHVGARVVLLGGRFLLLAGGAGPGEGGAENGRGAEAYDLLALGRAAVAPLPRAARSLVTVGAVGLVMDDAGASWVDFVGGAHEDATRPAGVASFADVAGGAAVEDRAGPAPGATYVVGPTRASAPTRAILRVEGDLALVGLTLGQARRGAAAASVPGAGLVVAGGSAEGPGAEFLAPGATAAIPLPFPADPVEGAGAVAIGAEDHGRGARPRILLAGGVLPDGSPAPTRLLDPACQGDCAPEPLGGADLPIAGSCAVFPAPPPSLVAPASSEASAPLAIAVCEAAEGALTRVFAIALDPPAATELPLREPRARAAATPIPGGALALAGGLLPSGAPARSVEVLRLR